LLALRVLGKVSIKSSHAAKMASKFRRRERRTGDKPD